MPSTFKFDYLLFVRSWTGCCLWTSSRNINCSKWQNIFSHLPHAAVTHSSKRARNQICSRFSLFAQFALSLFGLRNRLGHGLEQGGPSENRLIIFYTHFVRHTSRLAGELAGRATLVGCYLTIFRSPILFIARARQRKTQITDNPLVVNNSNTFWLTHSTRSPIHYCGAGWVVRVSRVRGTRTNRTSSQCSKHRLDSCKRALWPFSNLFVCGFGLSTQHKKCIPNFSLSVNSYSRSVRWVSAASG